MVTITLVDPSVDETQRLLDELDRAGFPISAAFWSVASGDGQLVIVSPLVDREGGLDAARLVRAALDRRPDVHLKLADMAIVSEGDLVYHRLRMLGLPSKLATPMLLNLQFPSLSTYAPYIPEDTTDIKVYVYRLAPKEVAGHTPPAIR